MDCPSKTEPRYSTLLDAEHKSINVVHNINRRLWPQAAARPGRRGSARPDRRALRAGRHLVTSNLDFTEWDQAFPGNRLLASATVDRLRHNAYCLTLDGASYRAPRQGPNKAKTVLASTPKNNQLLNPRRRSSEPIQTGSYMPVRGGSIVPVSDTMKKSLTYDQGKEMARHEILAKRVKIDVYFADPHSPWQRPTNENTNGLVREYLPKGLDLAPISQGYLNAIARQLNNRPRKCLDFETPAEVFAREIMNFQPGVALQS
jgi:hypothetical protein